MNTVIFGKGVMGQAIGSLLEYNQVEFEYIDVGQALTHAPKIAFIAVPVQHIREALIASKAYLSSETVFINCAKGIENTTLLLPHEIVEELFSPRQYGAFIGPSFAEEIVTQQPTSVSFGTKNILSMPEIRSMLETPYFFLEETPAYQAIELAAALKNVYAIAAGFAYGIGCQMNTRALLMSRALDEMAHVLASVGYAYPSLAIPGIAGDLFLTCSSEESRNFRFGEQLAGASSEAELQKLGTVEGYHTSISIAEWSRAHAVQLPLTTLVRELIGKGGKSKQDFISFLMSPAPPVL